MVVVRLTEPCSVTVGPDPPLPAGANEDGPRLIVVVAPRCELMAAASRRMPATANGPLSELVDTSCTLREARPCRYVPSAWVAAVASWAEYPPGPGPPDGVPPAPAPLDAEPKNVAPPAPPPGTPPGWVPPWDRPLVRTPRPVADTGAPALPLASVAPPTETVPVPGPLEMLQSTMARAPATATTAAIPSQGLREGPVLGLRDFEE